MDVGRDGTRLYVQCRSSVACHTDSDDHDPRLWLQVLESGNRARQLPRIKKCKLRAMSGVAQGAGRLAVAGDGPGRDIQDDQT